MQNKLERLLRYHRQNVFNEDSRVADLHHKALLRLKQTKTFKAMSSKNFQHNNFLKSEKLLKLYA